MNKIKVHKFGGLVVSVMTLEIAEMSSRRCRLFENTAQDDTWLEVLTGELKYNRNEREDTLSFTLEAEDKATSSIPQFTSVVHVDTLYERDNGTIITWDASEIKKYALSFEEEVSCDEFVNIIFNFQHFALDGSGRDEGELDSPFSLPEPSVSNLDEIESILLQNSYSIHVKQHAAQYIIDNKYVDKLFDIFDMNVDLENTDSLSKLYSIFKLLGNFPLM